MTKIFFALHLEPRRELLSGFFVVLFVVGLFCWFVFGFVCLIVWGFFPAFFCMWFHRQ